MSRLIDADVMHSDINKFDLEGRMSLKNIKRYIDVQPTAYDIDKVVEQLEAEAWEYECFWYEDSKVVDLVDALEIVKKGGVEWDLTH